MNQQMNGRKVYSRRDFIGAAVVAGGTVLAGCAPKVASTAQPISAAQPTGVPAAAIQKWSFEVPPAAIADSQIAKTVTTEVVIVGTGVQVCDANDQPIPGLYNIGTMVGDYFGDIYNFRISGNNLGANCVTFGYLTGKLFAKKS